MKGIVVVALLSCLCLWPLLFGPVTYTTPDTDSYLRGGARMWEMLGRMLADLWPVPDSVTQGTSEAGKEPAPTLTVDSEGRSTVGRSFMYSMFAYAAYIVGNDAFLSFIHAFMVLFVAGSFISMDDWARRDILIAGVVYLAAMTSLSWYSVVVSPDILAAVPILFGALLVRRFDDLSAGHRWTIVGITAFAAASHYGNGPLVFGIVLPVLAWRLLSRRLTVAAVLAGAFVILFSPLANITASTAVLKQPSLAPQRLPILLARSLEDGPAHWYLTDACPEADLAICSIFGDSIPDRVGVFLWSDEGINDITPAQMQSIRQEEYLILARAFLAYPVEQTRSLLGNAAKQSIMVGLRGIHPTEPLDDQFFGKRKPDDHLTVRLRALFHNILPITTWVAAVPLALLLIFGSLKREQIEVLVFCMFGLILNAVIFGGLSFPIDRYQTRVIWILPMLTGLFLAQIAARRSTFSSRRTTQN